MREAAEWVNKASLFIEEPYYNYFFIVRQYDENDTELQRIEGKDLFSLPNFRHYYYRLDQFISLPRGRVQEDHFGVCVSNEGSNSFDFGIYQNQFVNELISSNVSFNNLIYILDRNIGWHREKLIKISKLKHEDFEKELHSFLSTHLEYREINDLNTVKKTAGLYLMVLDDYACCYIGQAKDIALRIRQHWRKTNYGTGGIDMFKAFDTTRIFVACTDKNIQQKTVDQLEYAFIHAIDNNYLLNCLGGGGSLEFIHSDSPILGYGTDPV